MSRLNRAAFHFALTVFCITVAMYAAHAPFSTALFVSILFTLVFGAWNSFIFMKSTLLYLREGEQVVIDQSSQPHQQVES